LRGQAGIGDQGDARRNDSHVPTRGNERAKRLLNELTWINGFVRYKLQFMRCAQDRLPGAAKAVDGNSYRDGSSFQFKLPIKIECPRKPMP
jgi:hypothetical protein